MAQRIITTTPVNSGLGTPINQAFDDCNDNFSELYSRAQTSPPATLIGSIGDQAGMYAYDENYFYYCYQDYDGSSVIWAQISQIGNTVVTQIGNGTTSVAVPSPNSSVFISVGGVSNTAVFSNTGNLTLSNALNSVTISASGNVQGSNIVAGTLLQGSNIVATGNISAVGNIAGNFFTGNGRFLTGIVANYGNAEVAAYLPTYTGNLYDVNIFTDGYFYSNGTPFVGSGGGGSYGNAEVAAYLPIYTGNTGATLTTHAQPYITSVGNLTGLTVNGLNPVNISPIGTGITIAPTFGGHVTIEPTGIGSINNMIIGNVTPSSARFTDVSVTGNITGGNLLSGSAVSASGNISGQYLFGDGSFITNIGTGSTYGDANVAAFLPTYTGNILAGNVSVMMNQTVGGNTTATNVNATANVNVTNTVNTNKVIGQLTGTVNGVNTTYGIWDFGSITGTTFESPIAWIFAQTSAGNVDMGTVVSPSSNNIDIGTIY